MTPDQLLRHWKDRLDEHESRESLLRKGEETELHVARCDMDDLRLFVTLMLECMKENHHAHAPSAGTDPTQPL